MLHDCFNLETLSLSSDSGSEDEEDDDKPTPETAKPKTQSYSVMNTITDEEISKMEQYLMNVDELKEGEIHED